VIGPAFLPFSSRVWFLGFNRKEFLMLRIWIGGLCALMLCAVSVRADDVKGKVKSTDADKNTITITVDDKDQTVTVAKDAKITRLVGKKIKKAQTEDVPGGLNGLAAGSEVTVTTEKKDGKDVATAVKVEGLTTKKKKNK